jgi:hypothetical protein
MFCGKKTNKQECYLHAHQSTLRNVLWKKKNNKHECYMHISLWSIILAYHYSCHVHTVVKCGGWHQPKFPVVAWYRVYHVYVLFCVLVIVDIVRRFDEVCSCCHSSVVTTDECCQSWSQNVVFSVLCICFLLVCNSKSSFCHSTQMFSMCLSIHISVYPNEKKMDIKFLHK